MHDIGARPGYFDFLAAFRATSLKSNSSLCDEPSGLSNSSLGCFLELSVVPFALSVAPFTCSCVIGLLRHHVSLREHRWAGSVRRTVHPPGTGRPQRGGELETEGNILGGNGSAIDLPPGNSTENFGRLSFQPLVRGAGASSRVAILTRGLLRRPCKASFRLFRAKQLRRTKRFS
jgi:hypothetical protein